MYEKGRELGRRGGQAESECAVKGSMLRGTDGRDLKMIPVLVRQEAWLGSESFLESF